MVTGMEPPAKSELPRLEDRITFFYTDNCRLEKDDGAIRIETEEGSINVPAGMLCVLMLGPGTTVTHRMIQTATDAGMCIVWCGERGVRFYAGGSPLSGDTKLLMAQAKIVSNPHLRLSAAKRMYKLRYPEEDVTSCSMKQLLGREGTKVYQCYRHLSEQYHIPWKGRKYDPENFDDNDPLQNALSCANACLYGVCYSVIFAMGLSPGLGIIHTGLEKSFVLDIADLYKEKLSFPIAFREASKGLTDIDMNIRIAMRDLFRQKKFLKLIVSDIAYILNIQEITQENINGRNHLWAGYQEIINGGTQYGI